MPKRIEKITGYSGGMESTLTGWGTFFIISGIIGFIVALINGLGTGPYEHTDMFMVGAAFAVLLNGLIGGVLLRAGAEVIRLLKKLNGLNFAGEISPVSSIKGYACSACGTSSSLQNRHRCHVCKEDFDTSNNDVTDDGY